MLYSLVGLLLAIHQEDLAKNVAIPYGVVKKLLRKYGSA